MEMQIGGGGGRRRQPNLVFAIFMIGAGILLFLSNLGYLPLRNVWDYWPPIFVAIGLGRLTGKRRPGGLIVGVLFVVTGVVFTLVNTGIFRLRMHDDSWPLSLVFLALGIGGLAQALDGGKGTGRSMPLSGTAPWKLLPNHIASAMFISAIVLAVLPLLVALGSRFSPTLERRFHGGMPVLAGMVFLCYLKAQINPHFLFNCPELDQRLDDGGRQASARNVHPAFRFSSQFAQHGRKSQYSVW